jgi:hypothetical protein
MNPITPVSNPPSPSVAPTHSHLDLTHLIPSDSERPLSMRVSPRDRQPNSAQDLESKRSENASKIITFDKSNWESYWSHAKALVVGMSIPGNNNCVTVALGSHDLRSLGTKADFQEDILDICDKNSFHKQFSRIVFHGCCPITRLMGSVDCGGMKKYERQIVARDLAEKTSKLVSDKGGFLFFRHCIKGDGILPIKDNRKTRKKFINAFKEKGFIFVSTASAPYRIKIDNPVIDLPDPDPRIKNKWAENNGAMIFYKPPIT